METVKRGRPRSETVAARDEKVRSLVLERGPVSRNDLMDLLDLTGPLTYLSLSRLRSRGLVDKCLDEKGNPVWCPPGWAE